GPAWPVIFFSILSLGAIAVPIGVEYSLKQSLDILDNSGCKILFASKNAEILKKSPPSLKIITVDSEFLKEIERGGTKSLDWQDADIERDDTACILYTSGTTAEAKGAVLSHGNFLSNIEALNALGIFSESEGFLSILPLHHVYPLVVTMMLPLLYGAKIIYSESIKPDDISRALKETNPELFVAVPQFLHLFHEKITIALRKLPLPLYIFLNGASHLLNILRNIAGINLNKVLFGSVHKKFGKNLHFLISGGAKLNEEAARDLFRLGFSVLEGYGLTETSPALSFNPSVKSKIGSVGLPLHNVEIKISDKDDTGIGEVIARGPSVMKGYYKRDDLTKEAIRDGWFHTGDLGYLDSDGYLFLTGRSKEMIVLSSGLNINPKEIEDAYLKQVPASEICVIDVPTKKAAASTALWAIVRPDLNFFRKYGEVNLKDVIKERIANVSKTLPVHKRVLGFSVTLEEFPRTLLGKIKRYALRDRYKELAGRDVEFTQPKRKLTNEDIAVLESEAGKLTVSSLSEMTNTKRKIHPDDTIEMDIGLDSLGRIELASALERAIGLKIDGEIIGKAFTVGDLIKGITPLILKRPKSFSIDEKSMEFGTDYWKNLFEIPPNSKTLSKIDLTPAIGAWIFGILFSLFVYLYFRIFHGLKVEGKENFPLKGPCILYANHTSFYDGLVLSASFPMFPRLDLFFVGFRAFFDVPVIRNLIKIGRIIPLDLATHLLEALRSSYYVLKSGRKICMFPEGLRTLDGKVADFKKGFGILAKESNVKLLPVYIDGAFGAWPRTKRFPTLFRPIKVKFGRVIKLEELADKSDTTSSYEAICLEAKNTLIKLSRTK
ncbi:MAG: AMP-binding protein, partial [Candidatus Omnitrophica bacterium]|nr:AMP-binding protein [Candidatus Omnitrophota bacterium]